MRWRRDAPPRRAGDAVLRLLQAELVEQRLEALAVLGEVDGVGRGAEDRDARILQRLRELQRRLAAELHDHALERAALFGVEDFQHVLGVSGSK
jgi:hypothetical protein